MNPSQFAATNIMPLLARLILCLAFLPAGWNNLMRDEEFTGNDARRLRELGVQGITDPDPSKADVALGAMRGEAYWSQLLPQVLAQVPAPPGSQTPPSKPPANAAPAGAAPSGSTPAGTTPGAGGDAPNGGPGTAGAAGAGAPSGGGSAGGAGVQGNPGTGSGSGSGTGSSAGGGPGAAPATDAGKPTERPSAVGAHGRSANAPGERLSGAEKLSPLAPLTQRSLYWLALLAERAGIPFPIEVAWGVSGVQLVGGACVLLGLFSRVWGALMAMIVAAIFVTTSLHAIKDPGFFRLSADQTNMIFAQLGLFVLALSVFLVGPGAMSLDRAIFRKRRRGASGQKYA